MANKQTDNFRIGQQKPIDDKYMNGLDWYDTIEEAKTLVPFAERHPGLKINVAGVEHWWPSYLTQEQLDYDPIEYKSGGGLSLWEQPEEGDGYGDKEAVIKENLDGSFTIWVSTEDENEGEPGVDAGWRMANEGEFVTVAGTPFVMQQITGSKSFAAPAQFTSYLQWTLGGGTKQIITRGLSVGGKPTLRFNLAESSSPGNEQFVEAENDFLVYNSVDLLVQHFWKQFLMNVAAGNTTTDVVLVLGTDGEVKKLSFSPADDSNVVHKTGNELNIKGKKRFIDDDEPSYYIELDPDGRTVKIQGPTTYILIDTTNGVGAYTNATSQKVRFTPTGGIELNTSASDSVGATIKSDNITGTQKTFQHPNKSGTYAMLDDVLTEEDVEIIIQENVIGLWDDRGSYDASVNTFPTTGGSGAAGAILKGDIWTISVPGTLGGEPVIADQTVRALVDSPGQTAGNWTTGVGSSDVPDATESIKGKAQLSTQAIIENESTTNDTDIVTPKKWWFGFGRALQLAWTWVAKQTFTAAPRFSSTTASQYLKVDATKDLVSVANIPAADIDGLGSAITAAAPAETATTIGTLIHGSTNKVTPVGADEVSIWDSVTGLLQRLSITNFYNYLKSAFDSVYEALADKLLTGGAITYVGTDATVAAATWRVGGTGYSKGTSTVFSAIALSSSGNQRYIGFYGTTSNTVTKVEGSEGVLAGYPTQPANTALIGYLLVTDAGGTAIAPDLSGYLDKAFQKVSGTTGGTNAAYTLALTPTLTTLLPNQLIIVSVHTTNLANATLAVDATGAKGLRRQDNTAVQAGDLVTGIKYIFIYNGAYYQMAGLISSNFISNGTSSQTASFYITGTARIDSSISLGITAGTTHWVGMAANTATKASLLLTPSATDYTGTVLGSIWNNTGELKFVDTGALVNRILKVYQNALLSAGLSGSFSLRTNQYGDVGVGDQEVEAFVMDSDVITAITGATYSSNRATITPASSKVFYTGQMYDDGTYTYLAINDNSVRRW
jgi:hypothetical protein